MRIGLVVDATCDLPPEFLAAHGIRVMPIGIRLASSGSSIDATPTPP